MAEPSRKCPLLWSDGVDDGIARDDARLGACVISSFIGNLGLFRLNDGLRCRHLAPSDEVGQLLGILNIHLPVSIDIGIRHFEDRAL